VILTFLALACALCPPDTDPDSDYRRGMALARAGSLSEARQCFEAGRRKAPRDPRFPLELAGVAFRQKDPRAARGRLSEALRLDPGNGYANDFLATIYFLDGNLEAALEYWNRIGKPRLEQVLMDPQPRIDPVLLDRAFAFSPAAVIRLDELRATQARLELLNVFSRCRFELAALDNGAFDLHFRSLERGGRLAGLLALLRGLPYQTVYPELINLGGAARNFTSLVRWDAEKRRVRASFSAPLGRNPGWRYGLHLDARKENWIGDFRLERLEAGARIESSLNGRTRWMSGLRLARRKFTGAPPSDALFTDGVSLGYAARLGRRLLDLPERRLVLDSSLAAQAGRTFAAPLGSFSTGEVSIAARWFPQARGDDYETSARLRAGRTWGRVPFDELFQLGLERDNDLWLRGHVGTRAGRKGAAPLGRDYLLANWQLDKTVLDGAFVKVRLGPFLDSGRVWRGFVPWHWLWDAGLRLELRLLGHLGLSFSWGKDLRSGRNAFYLTTSR